MVGKTGGRGGLFSGDRSWHSWIWWWRQVAKSLGGDRLGYSVTSRSMSVQAQEPVEDISHFNNVHTIKEMLVFLMFMSM